MGCCAICENIPSDERSTGCSDANLRDIQHLNVLRFDPYALSLVPFALDLEHYAQELRMNAKWTMNADLQFCRILTLSESIYSAKSPVISVEFEPFTKFDSELFVRLILEPQYRLKWDSLLAECRELPGELRKMYYSIYKLPFPFSNRDFIETATVVPFCAGLHVVKYSTEECDVQSRHERGITNFFVASAETKEHGTEVVITGQVDLNLPFKQHILMNYAKDIFKDWIKDFLRALDESDQ